MRSLRARDGPWRHAIGVVPSTTLSACGMWTYSHASFRIQTIGPRRFRLEPATMIVVTHRRETDVPVICPPLYFGARLWRNVGSAWLRRPRRHVPAGLLRGLPGGASAARPPCSSSARRRAGSCRVFMCIPSRARTSPAQARWSRACPRPHSRTCSRRAGGELRARAAAGGLPRRAACSATCCEGEYADLLWRPVAPEEAARADDGFWAGARGTGGADFRVLVDLVRGGGTLVVFPEGRPVARTERSGLCGAGSAPSCAARSPSAFLPVAHRLRPARARPYARPRLLRPARIAPPGGHRGSDPPPPQTLDAVHLRPDGWRTSWLAGRDDDRGAARGSRRGRPGRRGGRSDPELLEPRPATRSASTRRSRRRARARSELPFLAREYESARARSSRLLRRGVLGAPPPKRPGKAGSRSKRAEQRDGDDGERVHREDIRGRLVRRDVDSLSGDERQVVERADARSGGRNGERQVADAFEQEVTAERDVEVERLADDEVHRHVGEPHGR